MTALNPLINLRVTIALLKTGHPDILCASFYDVTERTMHELCAKRTEPESNQDPRSNYLCRQYGVMLRHYVDVTG